MSTTRPTLLLLGAAAGMAQAIVLREALAALGGAELMWGLVMATWLIAVAVGARVGCRLAERWSGRTAVAAIPLATATGVVLMRALPALQHTAPGELTSTLGGIVWWALAVVPTAALVGLPFAALVPSDAAGPAHSYALEAIGASAGGLAVAALLGPASTAVALLGAVAATALLMLWPLRRWLAIMAAVVILASTIPIPDRLARLTWHWSQRPGDLGGWAETRHQRLEWSRELPLSVYGDGRLLATWPEPYLVTPAAHLRLLLHPHPRRVLIVGGLLDGTLAAVLRHPVEEVHVVADDPALVARVLGHINADLARPLASPAVRVHRDPIETLTRVHDLDLILLTDPGPPSLRTYRTHTVEALTGCRRALAADGLVVVDLPVADTYLGGSAGLLIASLAATTRTAFERLAVLPGEHVALVAAGPGADLTLDPGVLAARWATRGIDDLSFDPAMLPMLVDPARGAEIMRFIVATSAPPSTVARSPAVLAATALDLGRRGHLTAAAVMRGLADSPRWPAPVLIGVIALALLLPAAGGHPPRSAPALALGSTAMGSWIVLVTAWQATIGSAYSQIGALTGCLMAGIGLGAWWAGHDRAVSRRVWMSLAAGAGIALSLGTGLPYLWPRVVIPLLLAAVGLVTGAGFPGAAALIVPARPRQAAAHGFAADDAGAAIAAALVGTVLLPWLGVPLTSLLLATVALASIPAAVMPHPRARRP